MSPPSAFIVVAVGFLFVLGQKIEAKPNCVPSCSQQKPEGEYYPPSEKKNPYVINELRSIKNCLENVLEEEEQCEDKPSEYECDQNSYGSRNEGYGSEPKPYNTPSHHTYEKGSRYGQSERKEHSYSDNEPCYGKKESSEQYQHPNGKEGHEPVCCKVNINCQYKQCVHTPNKQNYMQEPEHYTDSKPVVQAKSSCTTYHSQYSEGDNPTSNYPNRYSEKKEIHKSYQSCTKGEGSYQSHGRQEEYKPSYDNRKPAYQMNNVRQPCQDNYKEEHKETYSDNESSYQDNQYKNPSQCGTDSGSSYVNVKQCDNDEKYQSRHQVKSYKEETEDSYPKCKPSDGRPSYHDNQYKPSQGREYGATYSQKSATQSCNEEKYHSRSHGNIYKGQSDGAYSNIKEDKSAYKDNQYKQPTQCHGYGETYSQKSVKQGGYEEKYKTRHEEYSHRAEAEPCSPRHHHNYHSKGEQSPYQNKGHTEDFRPRYNPNYNEKGYQHQSQGLYSKKDQRYNPKPNYGEMGYQEPQNSSCMMDTNPSYKRHESYHQESHKPQQTYQTSSRTKASEQGQNYANNYHEENRCQQPSQAKRYQGESKSYDKIAVPYSEKHDCGNSHEKQNYEKSPVISNCYCKQMEDKKSYKTKNYGKDPQEKYGKPCSKKKESKSPNTYGYHCEIEGYKPTVSKSNYGKQEYKSYTGEDYKDSKKEPSCYVVKPSCPDQDNASNYEEEESENSYNAKEHYLGCYSAPEPYRNRHLTPDRNY